MTRYALSAALLAILALGGWAWLQTARVASLSDDLSEARRELAVAEQVATQAREAQRVADAYRAAAADRAREYDTLREGLLRRDDDAPIPDILRDAVERLRARSTGGAESAGDSR
ncbi:MAG: hypothetical protein ABNH26_08860 [Celeribacter sp.]